MLFKSVTPNQICDTNNSFRIIFIKINIIKVDIIEIYTKNIQIITKISNNTRVYKIQV